MAVIYIFRVLALSLILFSSESALELFSIGSQLEFEGKISEAIDYYKRAREKAPEAIEIYVSLASALYMLQRFDEGIVYAQEALTIEPDDARLCQIIALGYVGKRDFKNAIEYYERTLEIEPNVPEINMAISTLLEASGEIANAINVLERMPSEVRTVDVYLRLAALSGKINDHVAAIDYYRQGHALDTSNVATIIGIGTGFDMIGMKDSAIYYYEQVNADTFIPHVAQRLVDIYIDTDTYDRVPKIAGAILEYEPDNNHVRRSLGFAYYKQEMFESAANEFYVALRYDPGDTYSAFYLSRIYFEQAEYDKAMIELNNALNINPDFIELWIYSGFVALEKEQFDVAQHAFTEAAYRGGDLAQIYYLLGAIAETQENDVEAYSYYKKALVENRSNLSALQALANLTSRLGRDREAFKIFQQILDVDTANAVALNYVGYTYAERNDSLEYALELVNKALDIDVDNGYYIDSRGWIFYMMGRYEDALQELKRASEIVEDAVILEHLGDVYIKLDDLGRARDAYDRALEFEPDNRELRRKVQQLK
ncbi:hypothetical protein AMJ83_01345 [candidate division WOR_3 bacterium SM23_42]|uniref:Uncharacterized protein n=1 Tax=candidate division WOR_3 bacterium SM23_42 TaxID=1703779 RepID=A0A0S8FWA1_UNCW3|nr:MAG: hypothetical protein AMJ83_01345 [candidate division WOR_3 bacterium SM23_42]